MSVTSGLLVAIMIKPKMVNTSYSLYELFYEYKITWKK